MSKNNNNGNEEGAKLRLTTLIFDTPDKRMPELTHLNRREAFYFSMMEANEQSCKKRRGKPLSQIWRESMYKHARSVDSQHLKRGSALAEAELFEDIDDEGEGFEL